MSLKYILTGINLKKIKIVEIAIIKPAEFQNETTRVVLPVVKVNIKQREILIVCLKQHNFAIGYSPRAERLLRQWLTEKP